VSISERKTDVKHLVHYLNKIVMPALQNVYALDLRVSLQLCIGVLNVISYEWWFY
jgi:hypothetical protein